MPQYAVEHANGVSLVKFHPLWRHSSLTFGVTGPGYLESSSASVSSEMARGLSVKAKKAENSLISHTEHIAWNGLWVS